MYEFQPYPSIRYHRSGAQLRVTSEAEDAAIGYPGNPDWADTPAKFAEPAKAEDSAAPAAKPEARPVAEQAEPARTTKKKSKE